MNRVVLAEYLLVGRGVLIKETLGANFALIVELMLEVCLHYGRLHGSPQENLLDLVQHFRTHFELISMRRCRANLSLSGCPAGWLLRRLLEG